jgi:hypothetical protein
MIFEKITLAKQVLIIMCSFCTILSMQNLRNDTPDADN